MLLFAVVLVFSGCLKDKVTRTYSIMRPVYESKATVLASISSGTPATVKHPGKIFLYGNYIFLNEVDKGVHIIDNSNPATPVNKAFLPIPGNLDIAVKGNMLYADLYNDLLAIDISNPLQTELKTVVPDVFPDRVYLSGSFGENRDRIIVDWIIKDTTVDESNQWQYPVSCPNCEYVLSSSDAGGKSAPGIAGSMARFAVVNNYLYTVNNTSISALSIEDPAVPVVVSNNNIGWSIETLFPFRDKLFIGSATGMFVYDISDPALPTQNSSFTHMRSCDPVIANDVYAFVTLRSGATCGGQLNQLDILDVTNIAAPQLIKSYQLSNPHGLAKDGDLLFICDGNAGLRVYDASNVYALKQLEQIANGIAYDCIAWNNRLLVSTDKGIFQYDYSAPGQLKELSLIAAQR